MPLYRYKISDRSGKISETTIEAESQTDALHKLKQDGFMPISMIGQSAGHLGAGASGGVKGGVKFDPLDFTNRLAPLLNAHIQLARALAIIEEGAPPGQGKMVVNYLKRGLHEGKKLSQLIKDQGNAFPPIFSNLIAAGEESGLLAETTTELQRFLVQRKELREFFISSSIYPILIIMVTTGVVLFLLFIVIPQFAATIQQSGKPLSAMIKLMLDFGNLLKFLWWFWLILGAGITFLVIQVRRGGIWKTRWDTLMVKLPIWRKFVLLLENSVFFRTLGMLTMNHIHLLPAVRSAVDVIQNRVVSKTLMHVPDDLKKGEKMSQSMKESPYIPLSSIQLVRIGEESGRLGEMISAVADMAETNMKDYIRKMLALFVPVTILLLSVVVATVVISIFLAIMEMKG